MATVVEDDQKAPFSIATTPRCTIFKAFGMTRPGIELRSLGPLANTQPNGLEDLCSIPVSVIPKALKMVLDTSLLNTQQYKVRITGKVEQSRERSSSFPYTSL